MKRKLLLLFLFVSFTMFGQSNFSNGFSDGYKKGYCQNQGIGCLAPISPISPIPNVNENLNSYQDGYNRGFEVGLNAQKNSNTNSETRERYQTSRSRFTAQSVDLSENHIYNPYANSNLLDLKIKAISAIIERAKNDLENERYDDAIAEANNLQSVQPGLAVSFKIRSVANYNKNNLLTAYNEGCKAYYISNKADTEWYNFINKEMQAFLNDLLVDKNYNEIISVTEKSFYQEDLMQVYKGIGYYYLNDLKKAKKFLKKVENASIAKDFLNAIETNTFLPNPFTKSEQTKPNEQTTNKDNDETDIQTLFKSKEYEKIIEKLKPIEDKIERGQITDKSTVFSVYSLLTYSHYYTNNFEKTIKYSTKAISNSQVKEIGEIYFMRSLSKANMNDYYGSNSDLDYLIENFDQINYKGNNLATLYNNKAYNFVMLKNYKDAKPLVEKALSLNQNIDYIWDTKGEIEYNLGNYNECEKAMTNSIKIKGSDNSYFYRGLAKIKLGKKTEGCTDLSKAGELGLKDAYVEINKNCK